MIISRDTRRQSRGPRGHVRASQAAVRVLAVVEGLAVDAQDVGLQVALLGGAVGAVAALEGLPGCGRGAEGRREGKSLTGSVA